MILPSLRPALQIYRIEIPGFGPKSAYDNVLRPPVFFRRASSTPQFLPNASVNTDHFHYRGTVTGGGSLHNQVFTLKNEGNTTESAAQMSCIRDFQLAFPLADNKRLVLHGDRAALRRICAPQARLSWNY